MKDEPKRSKDLVCALPGCGNKLPPVSDYAGKHSLTDPWCSTTCCRAWHENPLPAPKSGLVRSKPLRPKART